VLGFAAEFVYYSLAAKCLTRRGREMDDEAEFRVFVTDIESGLRRALVAGLGPDIGHEAFSEALAYGWEHWARVRSMDNPGGYLYRVGYRWGLRARRRLPRSRFPPTSNTSETWVEPELPSALHRLSDRQRVAVVLVEAYGWTYQEAADFMSISRGAVETHVRRALRKLRSRLEVDRDSQHR
jgi:RNA polymerase sigma-70 factor (ECF subfamily)